MKRPYLSNREQSLVALAISVIVIGTYVGLRFMPTHRLIGELQQAAEATEQRCRTTAIPEEPDEDVAKLDAQLQAQQQLVATLKSHSDSTERRLAPTDSQWLIVDISRVARKAQVHVRVNEIHQSAVLAGNTPAAPTAKKARKNKTANPAPLPLVAEPIIPPPTAGWIERMSPGTVFARPLRRLEVEGSYLALNRFIHELESLPFHVAVLRLSVEKMPVLSMPGYPQALVAQLVLAL